MARDKAEKFAEKGIPAELVPILHKVGYNLVTDLEGGNPQKINQQIGEVIKKYKLEVTKPSVAEIEKWV